MAWLQQISHRCHIPPEFRMHVLVPSTLQVASSLGRPASLGNNTFKEKLLHLQVLCPSLAKKRNKIKIRFELFKTLKLLAQFGLAFLKVLLLLTVPLSRDPR